MSAYTPGPWEARKPDHIGGPRVYTAGKGSMLIATPGYLRDEAQSEANARLIAAAPELLEALRMVRDAFYNGADIKAKGAVMHAAGLAIAKATK